MGVSAAHTDAFDDSRFAGPAKHATTRLMNLVHPKARAFRLSRAAPCRKLSPSPHRPTPPSPTRHPAPHRATAPHNGRPAGKVLPVHSKHFEDAHHEYGKPRRLDLDGRAMDALARRQGARHDPHPALRPGLFRRHPSLRHAHRPGHLPAGRTHRAPVRLGQDSRPRHALGRLHAAPGLHRPRQGGSFSTKGWPCWSSTRRSGSSTGLGPNDPTSSPPRRSTRPTG